MVLTRLKLALLFGASLLIVAIVFENCFQMVFPPPRLWVASLGTTAFFILFVYLPATTDYRRFWNENSASLREAKRFLIQRLFWSSVVPGSCFLTAGMARTYLLFAGHAITRDFIATWW